MWVNWRASLESGEKLKAYDKYFHPQGLSVTREAPGLSHRILVLVVKYP